MGNFFDIWWFFLVALETMLPGSTCLEEAIQWNPFSTYLEFGQFFRPVPSRLFLSSLGHAIPERDYIITETWKETESEGGNRKSHFLRLRL